MWSKRISHPLIVREKLEQSLWNTVWHYLVWEGGKVKHYTVITYKHRKGYVGNLKQKTSKTCPVHTLLSQSMKGLQDTPRELYCRGRIPGEWPCQWVGGGVRVRLVMSSNLNFRCQLFRVVWKYTAASRDLVGKWVGERSSWFQLSWGWATWTPRGICQTITLVSSHLVKVTMCCAAQQFYP